MAIMYGKDLIGLVGPIVVKRGKGGKKIVQTRARQYKQNKASIKTAKMFGYGSSVACVIRHQLYYVVGSRYDSGMVNRFNTPIREVLNHAYNKSDGTFNFEQDSFSRLAEFELNIKSPLINYLWIKPMMTLVGNTISITIPAFHVPSQFTYPKQTNTCQISIVITQVNISQALSKDPIYHSFEINSDQQIYPATELVFEIANQCLCVGAIALSYSERYNGISTTFNSKLFNPANIIGALITPGVYVEPPAPPPSNIGYSPDWTSESDLRF